MKKKSGVHNQIVKMLWKKELNNVKYVDLFRGQQSVEMQYVLQKIEKMSFNDLGCYYKNDSIAEEHRRNGNEMFNNGRFIDAMEMYNKSLCFAKIGSATVGMAYANRATCFMRMKMFKNCLADIELAKQNQYPKHLMGKLEKRRDDCLKLMQSEDDRSDSNEAGLDFQANAEFPCLANVVTIQSNNEFGHHLVATADIEIGKTVMVEQCYVGVTKNDHYKSCNICLKEIKNFVPCKKCTSALFCFDCKDNELHGIECNMNFGCPAGFKFMDVVRTISLAKNAFANVEDLIDFVEDILKNDTMEPLKLVDSQSKYRAFFQSCDWKTPELHLQQVYLFYQLILDQPEMTAYFRTNAHQRFLMHLVQHHIKMILRGAFNKRIGPIGGEFITDTYINIVAKHLNHSCIPNVCHVLKNGSIDCIVIRPIKKGEHTLHSQDKYVQHIKYFDFPVNI